MIYRDVHASLMRFCNDFAAQFTPGVSPVFVNFDSSWDDSDLPKSDILGYMALTFQLDDQFVEGTFQVGYSTVDDKNLFRLVKALDALIEKLKPMSKIRVLDADTGEQKGFIICKNGTRLMPAVGTKTRPVQFVAVRFATTVTYEIDGEVLDLE